MTLMKQTTVSTPDDSLMCSENDGDLQTDCCMLSLTSGSLDKQFETLTLGDTNSGRSHQHSCESGIASLSASYSVQTSDSDRTDTLQSSGIDLTGDDRTLIKTEHKCFSDKVQYPKSCETVYGDSPVGGEKRESQPLQKREKCERIISCWDEMCKHFPDKDGDTLLHLAVLQTVTHLAQLVRLLGLRGQVNRRNRLYQTPLHLAVLTANGRATAVLRALGASLRLQDCRGNTPLHTACLRNDPHVLRVLLESEKEEEEAEVVGRSSGDTDTDSHVGHGREKKRLNHLPMQETVCPRNEISAEESLSSRGKEEGRGGGRSRGWGDVETTGLDELESGGDSDGGDTLTGDDVVGVGKDEEGEAERGSRREREVKAALCVKNYEGFTCLHLAVLHGNADLVALLLQHGADVNARDGKSGRTALHLAVDTPCPSSPVLSALLLHPQLHINATNFAQQTALQLARGRHHLELVELLHVRGARWSDSIHHHGGGYYSSSDSFSEEDMEEDLFVPYDDLRVAGQLLTDCRV
ncbi:uncharacterized protein LOC143294302 [Babylonia areolata]|uniref:uncharacterized protein LOC143294302 n=1 Tax=Babylonia areolata TaxID=304850 RepID=UPI003FD51F76